MNQHNKLFIAADLLLSAAHEYKHAQSDLDYVKCILHAGAVINICYPLIVEVGGKERQRVLAELAVDLMKAGGKDFSTEEADEKVRKFIASSLFVYNSLKHAGNKRKGINPTDDIYFEADLKEYANQLVGDAIDDFKRVSPAPHDLKGDLLDLLQSPWSATSIR